MRFSPVELFLKARKNTLPESILVCIAAALTSTFYFYEYQYEKFFPLREPLLLFMTAAIFLIWISCSLFAGRDGRFGFAIFTFAYWAVPFVYTLYYAGRDNVRQYNKWLALINKICSGLLNNPFSTVAEKTNTVPQTYAALLVMISLAVYMLGFFIRRRLEEKYGDGEEGYDGEYIGEDGDRISMLEADNAEEMMEIIRTNKGKSMPLSFGSNDDKKKDPPDLKSAVGFGSSDEKTENKENPLENAEKDKKEKEYDDLIDDVLGKKR